MSEPLEDWKLDLDKALQDEYDRCANGLSFRFETIRVVFRKALLSERSEVERLQKRVGRLVKYSLDVVNHAPACTGDFAQCLHKLSEVIDE